MYKNIYNAKINGNKKLVQLVSVDATLQNT